MFCRRLRFGLLPAVLLFLHLAAAGLAAEAVRGVIDLTSRDFARLGPARLDGQWEFHWQRLLSPADFAAENTPAPTGYFKVPGVWNDHPLTGADQGGDGHATFRLLVALPPDIKTAAIKIPIMSTAYRLWVDGRLLSENGVVSSDRAGGVPENRPVVRTFRVAPVDGGAAPVEIIAQVSNYHIHKGGMRVSLYVGPEADVLRFERRRLGFDLFLVGALLIMGVYHIVLYWLRREDRSLLYFAIFCLLIALRTLVSGERFLAVTMPGLLSWSLETRLDFLTICISPVIFVSFIRALYPEDVPRLAVRAVQWVGAAAALFVFVTPARIYADPIQYLLFFLLGAGVFGLVMLGVAAWRGRDGAIWFLLGLSVLVLAMANDILYASEVINTGRLVPLGMFFFIFSQSVLLSIKFARAFRRVENMSASMRRFVPQDFLGLIGRESIEDVRLGDQVEREMTVLFSDLRDFTTLSESMSPRENFDFLNAMLRRLGPLIREHNGFIDKYIGDAIMALFPGQPEDALRAAIAMNRELAAYNVQRQQEGFAPLRMGVGIHTGRLMLGTIGESERIEGTVISDAVNLASRLEGQTKVYGASVLISEATLFRLPDPDRYGLRMLGRARLKGKQEQVAIFEAFDGDDPETVARKRASRARFEKGVQAYYASEHGQARQYFQAIRDENPDDVAAGYYLDRIRDEDAPDRREIQARKEAQKEEHKEEPRDGARTQS